MLFMTFRIKPNSINIISCFESLGECLEIQKKKRKQQTKQNQNQNPTATTKATLMETDSYSTFIWDCFAAAVNDISVLQSPHKVLR